MHWLDQLNEWYHVIKDNIHLLLGGAFSFWIYQDTINKMSMYERVFYVILSIAIGFYGGNAIIELSELNDASSRAHLISIVSTIFGLALLGLARDSLKEFFDSVKILFIAFIKKWIG